MTSFNVNWQPSLENNLVKLVPLTIGDFDLLFEVAADPLIWEQHPARDRYKREVFQTFFDAAVSSRTAFLIVDKKTNEVIGSTRYYDFKPETSSVAIGYTFLACAYWGGAFNHSVKKLLLEYAFQYIDKVYFHIGSTNVRSQKAIERIGAIKIAEVNFDLNGKKLPHYEYVIEKEDYLTKNVKVG